MNKEKRLTPTRIYSYGCLPPVIGADLVDDQIRRAHHYRNALVRIERRRRERMAEVQRRHDTLGPIVEAIGNLETQIGEARRDVRLTYAGGKQDSEKRAALKESIAALRAELSILRDRKRTQIDLLRVDEDVMASLVKIKMPPRLAYKVTPWWLLGMAVYATERNDAGIRLRCEYAAVNEMAAAEQRAARAASGLGRNPGTYQEVEKAAKAWRKAPDAPRFRRCDEEGRVAVQIQKKGLTVEQFESGRSTQLRLTAATPRPGQTAIRATYRTVHIRVSSEGRGRKPVWAAFPMVLHRPLPSDGKIVNAWVIRRREGVARFSWKVQFVVKAESLENSRQSYSSAAVIAVDIKKMPVTGQERLVADWKDSLGQKGEVRLPATRLSSPTSRGQTRRKIVPSDSENIEKVKAAQSHMLDELVSALTRYRDIAPDWYRERTKWASKWRSFSRVILLERYWRDNRFAGDETIYRRVQEYMKQSRHLSDWESCERGRYIGRRREQYRTFAAEIVRRYRKIMLVKRDYRIEKAPPEHQPSTNGREARKRVHSTAPGELRGAIREAAKSAGVKVVEIKINGSERVCERLLASVDVVRDQAAALAGSNTKESSMDVRKRFTRRRLGTMERRDPLAGQDVTL